MILSAPVLNYSFVICNGKSKYEHIYYLQLCVQIISELHINNQSAKILIRRVS